MPKRNLDDLSLFMVVVRRQSFTRAAAELGMSQSSLSHTVRSLEQRLGLQLLNRTTRSISLTEAGERLAKVLGPRLEEIEHEINSLNDLKNKPMGTVRITAVDHVIGTIIWPKLEPVLRKHPEVKIEFISDYHLTDIVAKGFEIGVRRGDQVARGMIAVRMTPDQKMLVVGSPSYFNHYPYPSDPEDLTHHECINFRLSSQGGIYAWELEREGIMVQAKVEGQLTFNRTEHVLGAALAGYGLAYLPDEIVMPHVHSGELNIVMEEWGATFPGYHLYYPSRRKGSGAINLIIDALRLSGVVV